MPSTLHRRCNLARKSFTRSEAKRIGDLLHVDWSSIPLHEFHRGVNVELEHKDVTCGDPILTGMIAHVHLKESVDRLRKLGRPIKANYYELLDKYVEGKNRSSRTKRRAFWRQ